jgi:hypothetical protein
VVQAENKKHKELKMSKQSNLEEFILINSASGPNLKTSREAKKILDQNSLGSNFEEDGRMNDCYNFLTTIGISVDAISQKDFSFKQTKKNEEAVANPNIIERKDFKKFNNEYDKPDDKFPNEDDPFYQLDDARDKNEKQTNKIDSIDKSDLLVDIVDDILKINLVNNNSVKQFRSLK